MIKIKPSSNHWKNSTWILAGILLLSLGLNYLQFDSARKENLNRLLDNGRNQVKIAAGQALAKMHSERANRFEGELMKQRDSFKIAQKPLYEENKTLKKTIERLRPLVADKIAADPNLRDFSGAQDSAILKQSEIITSLELANANEISKNEDIRNEKRAEINELVLIQNGLQEDLVNEQGESRKWKKKADKRFNLGAGAGYGVTSTGGEIRTGPTINVSFYYRLLRF